jgi:hypothetical protein
MMPCKYCEPLTANALLRGLKQVGKTRYSGTRFERRYRCQDCGATCTMRGDFALMTGATPRTDDEWTPPETREAHVAGARVRAITHDTPSCSRTSRTAAERTTRTS